MRRRRLLLIEDDLATADSLVVPLEKMGLSVGRAETPEEGIRKWISVRPDLVLLDLGLPGKWTGLDVLRHMRGLPEGRDTIVLVITAYKDRRAESYELLADDYFVKPFSLAELKARIEALQKRSPIYRDEVDRIDYSLRLTNGQPIQIYVSGADGYTSASEGPLVIDGHYQAVSAIAHMHADEWRELVGEDGRRLFESVFGRYPSVLASYKRVVQPGSESRVHLTFETSRELLRAPFEWCRDPTAALGEEFLSLLHPMRRSVAGVSRVGRTLGGATFNDSIREGRPIRVLLIASNTDSIPGADAEVGWLDSSLPALFSNQGVTLEVTTINSAEASIEMIEEALGECSYHIVHYSGHAVFDSETPDESGLRVWRRRGCQGGVTTLKASRLHELTRRANVRFVYLSCCFGVLTSSSEVLNSATFLGLSHAIVASGVPSVLGFRSTVSDSGALANSAAFYRHLAETGELDSALYFARREVASTMPSDPAWMSVALLSQT